MTELCEMKADMEMSGEFNIYQLSAAYNTLTAVAGSGMNLTDVERGRARQAASLVMQRLLKLLGEEEK